MKNSIRKARKDFDNMLKVCFSDDTVKFFATGIRVLVKNGETSWDELGFTDDEIEERLRMAKVRVA